MTTAAAPYSVAFNEAHSRLTSEMLRTHALAFESTPTLSGDTPVPTPPASFFGGETQIGSTRPPSFTGFAKEEQAESRIVEEDMPRTQDFPEGGLRAYLAVLGGILVLVSTFGFSNSFAIFMAEYKDFQLKGYTTSQISWIGSVHLFICFGSSILSGTLFDKGYFRYQLATGSLGWILGMFMLSLSRSYWQIFLSHSVTLGLSVGIMFGPVLSSIGTYFLARRAFFIGTAAAGAALGTICFSVMLNIQFVRVGFGPAMREATYIMIALLLTANLIMRPRVFVSAPPPLSTLPLLCKFSRQASMWLTCLGIFACVVGLFIIMFFVQLFAKSHISNQTLADYSLSILNASAAVGRMVVGLLADRFGVFNTCVPIAALLSGMIFVMVAATSEGAMLAFLLIFGFAAGAFISIMASCFMCLADTVKEIGLRSGVGFVFVAVAALVGSPVAGAILVASRGSYWPAVLFSGGCSSVGVLLLLAARRTQVVRKGSNRV